MTTILNCRRMLCPMPVIKVQNALKDLEPGATLTVTCTDPGTVHDIPTWCRINGHEVIEQTENNGEYVFVIDKTTS